MKRSVKMALATSAVAVAAGLFLVGTGVAARGFGGPGGMGGMGMMGGLGHEMLQNVDTNGDGALTQDEINAGVDGRFVEFDADKNGNLSLAEFEALWAEITKPAAVRAFQFLDPDGDAAVAKAELEERFGTLVSRFDKNDDGMLSPDDRPHRGGPHGRWHGPMHGGPDDGPQDE
jgi:hypothetical protein